MTYHLLDHCNARNARELARTDLDARALGTLEWVPPHVLMWGPGDWRSPHSLGMQLLHGTRGHKISCGAVMDADEYDVREFGTAALSRNNYNVCRPFDEAWERPSPFYYTGLRPLCCEAVGGHPRVVEGMELTYGQPLKTENFSIERHTPSNHGHGAKCGCASNTQPPQPHRHKNATDIDWAQDLSAWEEECEKRRTSPVCQWCATNGKNTGRIICDDERAGRVSPSHAAGGYAEWQRGTMEFSVTDHDGTRPLGRITNMRSVDGFVVGDIELEDGSVVVERLMRSPFSSSEIGDADPATTERE